MKNTGTIEYRCTKCSKLLAVGTIESSHLEIKCSRCKHINFFFDQQTDQIVIVDINGVILYANNALSNITGYSLKEIIGEKPSLWGGQMTETFYKDLWHKIKEEKQIAIVAVTNKKKNGEFYEACLRISPILDEKGNPKFFVGIETRIPDKKLAEKKMP
jgi:PAS domain S-box-containing protein